MSICRIGSRVLAFARHMAPHTRQAASRPVVGLAALALGILVAGCGGGGGGDRSDYTPPQVSWALFQPSSMGSSGGTAHIMAKVTDASGIAWVRATLTAPDGSQSVLEMTWQSGGYYDASFQVPGNLGGDGLRYSATVSAADNSGSVSSAFSVGTLTVGGDSGPPPPPNL